MVIAVGPSSTLKKCLWLWIIKISKVLGFYRYSPFDIGFNAPCWGIECPFLSLLPHCFCSLFYFWEISSSLNSWRSAGICVSCFHRSHVWLRKMLGTVSTVLIWDLVYFMLFFFQNSIRGLFIASVSSPSENFEESSINKNWY